MSWFKRKDIGWKEINEEFTRWELRTPWFGIMLHRMNAPTEHQHYHDHPWNFIAIVLWGGYEEKILNGITKWRKPGSILWRPAKTAHKTTTYGTVSWSVCFTGPKFREWQGDIV